MSRFSYSGFDLHNSVGSAILKNISTSSSVVEDRFFFSLYVFDKLRRITVGSAGSVYECRICKQNYYNNKVAALKDTNVRKDSHDWYYQMLNDTITSPAVLGQLFNAFLANLTAHFTPLGTSPTTSVLDVPREFLVDTRKIFRALTQVKLNKSPGPDVVPNKTWKQFAWELAPVLSDIHNTSLR